jgi:hypothetical protein
VLSGDIGVAGNAADNSFYVVQIDRNATLVTTLDGLTISGGNADGTFIDGIRYGSGAGVNMEFGSSLTLRGVILENNRAADGGGAVQFSERGRLENVIVRNNSAPAGGGIFHAGRNTLTIINSIFTGNRADNGSAMLLGQGATIVNSTIAGNSEESISAQIGPSAVRLNGDNIVFANSIIWGNDGLAFNSFDGTLRPTLTNSIVQGGLYGGTDADPRFVGSGDLRLRPGSPAIDAGDNAAVPLAVNSDLDGNSRIVAYGSSAVVDMGAYEAVPPRLIVAVAASRLREGGQGVGVALRLNSRPGANVTVQLDAGSQAAASPASLVFTPQNWATPQSVTVTAVNDTRLEGLHEATLSYSLSSADGAYQGLQVAPTLLTVEDDERASAQLSSSTVRTGANGQGSYTLALGSAPSSTVIVTVTPSSELEVDPPVLIFTPANWSQPQTITFRQRTGAGVAALPSISHRASSADPIYDEAELPTVTVELSGGTKVYLPVMRGR